MTTDKTIDSSKVPQLIVQLPDGKEVHYPILGTEITVGRDPTNRISLSDNFVSKFHAKLLVSAQSITVVDLGSANKTRVNGKPIHQETVQFGDEIQFAGVKCRLAAPSSQRQEPPVAKPPAPGLPPPHPSVRPPAPPERAVEPPVPPARPKAPRVAPAAKKTTGPIPGRGAAPPPTATNPMTKLYIIGGILIGIALVFGILLRVLLVPSGEPGETENPKSTTSAPVSVPVTTTIGSGTSSIAPTQPGGNDQSVEHYFDQALSYLDVGRLKDARTNFLKVLELDPQNSRATTRLSLLEEEIERKAEQHFDNARQSFNFLRYEEAIAEWEMFMSLADSSDSRYAEAEQGIAQARAKLR